MDLERATVARIDRRFDQMMAEGALDEVRAVVADNVETKGHLMVTLDVQMLSEERHIMTCRHLAIYEPRQVRERS